MSKNIWKAIPDKGSDGEKMRIEEEEGRRVEQTLR